MIKFVVTEAYPTVGRGVQYVQYGNAPTHRQAEISQNPQVTASPTPSTNTLTPAAIYAVAAAIAISTFAMSVVSGKQKKLRGTARKHRKRGQLNRQVWEKGWNIHQK